MPLSACRNNKNSFSCARLKWRRFTSRRWPSSSLYRSSDGLNKFRCLKIEIGIIKDAEGMATAGHDTTIEQTDPAAIKTTETSPPEVGTSRRFAFVTPLSKRQGVNHVESIVTTGVHPTAM